jgi:hypothetical protein
MATLQKRKGKNNWEICYPLPVKLRELLKTPALNRSLGTPDKTEAKRRYPMKLVEVETEVAALLARHFPDDDTALAELRELIAAFKDADDHMEHRHAVSDKEAILDAMTEWGRRQRSRRLKAYRGTPQFEHQKTLADEIQSKAEDMVRQAVDPRLRITDLVEEWRKDVKPSLSRAPTRNTSGQSPVFLDWCKGKRYIAINEIDRRDVRAFVADCYHGRWGEPSSWPWALSWGLGTRLHHRLDGGGEHRLAEPQVPGQRADRHRGAESRRRGGTPLLVRRHPRLAVRA